MKLKEYRKKKENLKWMKRKEKYINENKNRKKM